MKKVAKMQVYKNLNNGLWSVRYKGKVIAHKSALILSDVDFRVSEAGRQRVLRERQKNVHAYANGNIIEALPNAQVIEATYNPYDVSYFYLKGDKTPIYSAKFAIFNEQGKLFVVL